MGDKNNQNKGTSTLTGLICLGLGAAAGWFIANLIEEEKQKENPGSTKPKTMDFNDTCAVCLDKFSTTEKVVTLICAHTFHQKCYNGIRKKECPVCRTPII